MLYANLNALVFDYVVRNKVGGVNLNFFLVKQFPVLPPAAYGKADVEFLLPRIHELTFTSHDLAGWARDVGHSGAPFAFDPVRRSIICAEIDAWFAQMYGLTRDELRYVLDPADPLGTDYPSETFRGLKHSDIAEFGDYRTGRLVLEAWDQLIEPARRARGMV